ncbi:MAG: hypothetical protein J0L93_10270 [Deltaproteobacteria bacterium]|nr:hypothetical protein [Deltaproteobacteria bacterium]
MRGCLQKLLILFYVAFVARAEISAANLDTENAQDQAQRLYSRFTGVSPSLSTLQSLTTFLQNGQTAQAAFIAMNDVNFYKLTIKNLFNPLSNKAQTNDLALNDFTATIVGLIINNQSFDQVLYGDVIYTGLESLQTNPGLVRQPVDNFQDGKIRPLLVIPGAANPNTLFRDFFHYSDLERFSNWPNLLMARRQSDIFALTQDSPLNAEDVSGLLTTRQWGLEFYSAGTNRRPVRYAFWGFLGKDLSQLHDANVSDARVRQDVDRLPGGNSQTFLNTCMGCHGNLDALAGAFAYIDFPSEIITYRRTVQTKQFRQDTVFPSGYRLKDNTWLNFWSTGPNANLGWRTDANTPSLTSGKGIKSFGRMLAATKAFSENMATKVFSRICLRAPSAAETNLLITIARKFETGFPEYSNYSASGAYNMRALFAETSKLCFGK